LPGESPISELSTLLGGLDHEDGAGEPVLEVLNRALPLRFAENAYTREVDGQLHFAIGRVDPLPTGAG